MQTIMTIIYLVLTLWGCILDAGFWLSEHPQLMILPPAIWVGWELAGLRRRPTP
jgi:hypothetical protein